MKIKSLAVVTLTGIAFFASAVIILSCGNDNPPVFPPDFNFALIDGNGESLLTSTDQGVSLFYYEGKKKTYINDYHEAGIIQPMGDGAPYPYYFRTRDGAIQSSRGIKEFYLQIGEDVDTIFLDVRGQEYKSVKFNGAEASFDKYDFPGRIYVLRK